LWGQRQRTGRVFQLTLAMGGCDRWENVLYNHGKQVSDRVTDRLAANSFIDFERRERPADHGSATCWPVTAERSRGESFSAT
jgi:hypothetical protein